MKFSLVISVFAEFLIDKRTYKDYVRKNIKPKHQYDYRSKGTVYCGIFYGKTYKQGKNSAYNSKY